MKFEVECRLSYDVSQLSTLIVNIGVVSHAQQAVLEEDCTVSPTVAIADYTPPGSENRYWRMVFQPGTYQVAYRAIAQTRPEQTDPSGLLEVDPADLPPETWLYLYPSRYCPSDQLLAFAQEQFGDLQRGYSRVLAICNWIYDQVAYKSGSTDSHTDATAVLDQKAGVCRDFAHVGITLCRALDIPARFVSAYAYGLEPPDFHACFEAYLGDRWYLFDPTRLVPRNSIVVIGTGRDAADVSFATIFGQVQLQNMQIKMQPLTPEDAVQLDHSTDAIAISPI